MAMLPELDLTYFGSPSPEDIDRDAGLFGIRRFGAIAEMAQRTTVLDHSIRVMSISVRFAEMLLALGVKMDMPRIIFISPHHDDPEIKTGDYPTPVKTHATPEERARMDAEELEAAAAIEHLVAKPSFVRSFSEIMAEYRQQATVEDRLVNFVDKFDGLNEAIHEVVTGTNKVGFRQVIEEYRPIFTKLREKNRDWQEVVENFVGPNFFDFPDPDSLTPKSIEDVNFSTAGRFIESIAAGNPDSYKLWLIFGKAAFRLRFLEHFLPAWTNLIPKPVLDDITRVKHGEPRIILPRSYTDRPTFGESLALEETLNRIDDLGADIRNRRGEKSAYSRTIFEPPLA